MARRAAVLAVVVVLTIAVAVQAGAEPQPILPADRAQAPSRLLDRTMTTCSVPVHAGLREIQVAATSGSRDPAIRSLWTHLASFSVRAGGFFSGMGFADAGVGAPEPKEVMWPGTSQGLSVSAACRLSDARVPLTTHRLTQGGVASPIRDAYECVAPRTVLVRIRATFRVPTRLRIRGGRAGGRSRRARGERQAAGVCVRERVRQGAALHRCELSPGLTVPPDRPRPRLPQCPRP